MTLFPDEIHHFLEKDPSNVKKYLIKTDEGKTIIIWGYNAKKCIFLTDDNLCKLQLQNKSKPIDCLLFPFNYKNYNLYLDTSCPAKDLAKLEHAKQLINQKLEQYPEYRYVAYEVMPSDILIESLPVLKRNTNGTKV